MSTTGMVMTVTDELLAEIEELAAGATEGPWKYETDEDSCYGAVFVKPDTEHYSPPICRIDHDVTAEFVAATDPTTIMALTAELRRLRAENAELAQSLAESRANDQAAMGWLTSLRWASGDRGERMLPELVTHIESLAKDAGRLEWMVTEGAVIASMNGTGLPMCHQVSFPLEICQQPVWFPSWREAVDAMMATQ